MHGHRTMNTYSRQSANLQSTRIYLTLPLRVSFAFGNSTNEQQKIVNKAIIFWRCFLYAQMHYFWHIRPVAICNSMVQLHFVASMKFEKFIESLDFDHWLCWFFVMQDKKKHSMNANKNELIGSSILSGLCRFLSCYYAYFCACQFLQSNYPHFF